MEVHVGVPNAEGRRSVEALTLLHVIGKDLQVELFDKRRMSKILISTSNLLSHHVPRGTGVIFHVGVIRPINIVECLHRLITIAPLLQVRGWKQPAQSYVIGQNCPSVTSFGPKRISENDECSNVCHKMKTHQ